ncbi:MAG: cytochrome c oxidase subunit II [Chloroflexota bacterium]
MRGRRVAAGAALVSLLAAACLPAPATTEARDIASLYTIFLAAAAVVAAIVLGLATWSVIRYRAGRTSGPGGAGATDDLPPQTHGNTRLEILWTVVPAVTIAVLFGFTLVTLARVDKVDPVEPARGAEIEVTAFRWGWTFTYPAEGISVSGFQEPGPEVVVPVGEPITVRLDSADVVHSFYVPRFLFKRDVVPGRQNVFQFTVEEAGSYGGQCAEFCGLYHARMPFTIRAESRSVYEAWLAAQR